MCCVKSRVNGGGREAGWLGLCCPPIGIHSIGDPFWQVTTLLGLSPQPSHTASFMKVVEMDLDRSLFRILGNLSCVGLFVSFGGKYQCFPNEATAGCCFFPTAGRPTVHQLQVVAVQMLCALSFSVATPCLSFSPETPSHAVTCTNMLSLLYREVSPGNVVNSR